MADLPEMGSVWSFRTRPLTEFSPLETGRYAVLKVIEATPRLIAVVLLDGVWNIAPDLEAVARRDLLLRRTERFDEGRFVRGEEHYHKAIEGGGWTIAEFREPRLVGVLPLTAQEAKFAILYRDRLMGGRYGGLNWLDAAAETRWREANDPEALRAERERARAKAAVDHAAREERIRTRLRGLTWETLLSETPFTRWDQSPPFPPAAFRGAAQAKIHETCRALQALGPKPKRADVRRLLKGCVEWFNAADAAAGEVIETEEREDIRQVLEEMAHVARQKALVEEIDAWRAW